MRSIGTLFEKPYPIGRRYSHIVTVTPHRYALGASDKLPTPLASHSFSRVKMESRLTLRYRLSGPL